MPKVVYFEFQVDKPERAIKFYHEVFGWDIKPYDGPEEYWQISAGPDNEPGINGGMMRRRGDNSMVYATIGVDNIDAFIEKVKANGGEVVVDKFPIPTIGWQAYFKDTEGNICGIHQPDSSAGK